MKTIYIKPVCVTIDMEHTSSLLSLSGVHVTMEELGGVDTSGTIDPAARRCNPFYKDGDDVLAEEEE